MRDERSSTPPSGCILAIVLAIGVIAGLVGGVIGGGLSANTINRLFGASTPQADKTVAPASQSAAQLWTCGMHPQVIQDHPGECPICHMQLTPVSASASSGASNSSGAPAPPERTIKYWWDPMMNPPYISDAPGKSPMGMDLVPVYEDESPTPSSNSAMVTIDPVVVQNMGVRTASVSRQPLNRSTRAVGYLDETQPNIRDVNLLVGGWVRRLQADVEGMHVQKGDPLFDLYSPELQLAIEELIAARRSLNSTTESPDGSNAAQTLYDAASRKLELWGLPREQINALAKLDRAPETITFTSPTTGEVTEKPIVEGAAVKAGDRVLRIVDHTTLWLDVKVPEKDVPLVSIGQTARVTIASRPGEVLSGSIIFIAPHVDMPTRTATVRMRIDNASLTLRPGMYAVANLETEIAADTLVVPREAVIDTGDRQIAFVTSEPGHFEPRQVIMGQAGDGGVVQVLDGLKAGETVVTSGQFLIDSESRLREAIQKFIRMKNDPRARQGTPTTTGEEASHGGNDSQSVAPVEAETQRKIDAAVSAYLRIARSLGAVQTHDTPIDAHELIDAANALREATADRSPESPASWLASESAAMQNKTLSEQREQFKAVSKAMVHLVTIHPPSAIVGEKVFAIHCPMAPGDWVQTTDKIANPYYATSMKSCGEVVRSITPAERPNP
jgi:membrane fusion protein, copper/silver efflux system